MKKVLATALLACALGMTGCKNNKSTAETTAPPPPPLEPAPMTTAPPPPMPTYVEPAPVAPAMDAAPMGARTYVVQRGDTLYGIARREYGDARRVRDIIAANPGINPNVIKVGQRLNLP